MRRSEKASCMAATGLADPGPVIALPGSTVWLRKSGRTSPSIKFDPALLLHLLDEQRMRSTLNTRRGHPGAATGTRTAPAGTTPAASPLPRQPAGTTHPGTSYWTLRSARHARDPSYLYTGSLLAAATETATRITGDPARRPPLSQTGRDFLHASERTSGADGTQLWGISSPNNLLVLCKTLCFSLRVVDAGEDLIRVFGPGKRAGVLVPVAGERADGRG